MPTKLRLTRMSAKIAPLGRSSICPRALPRGQSATPSPQPSIAQTNAAAVGLQHCSAYGEPPRCGCTFFSKRRKPSISTDCPLPPTRTPPLVTLSSASVVERPRRYLQSSSLRDRGEMRSLATPLLARRICPLAEPKRPPRRHTVNDWRRTTSSSVAQSSLEDTRGWPRSAPSPAVLRAVTWF